MLICDSAKKRLDSINLVIANRMPKSIKAVYEEVRTSFSFSYYSSLNVLDCFYSTSG